MKYTYTTGPTTECYTPLATNITAEVVLEQIRNTPSQLKNEPRQ